MSEFCQTADLGLRRDQLEEYLVRIGYWKYEEFRKRHAYVLSPSAYVMSVTQQDALARLGKAAYAGISKLSGELSRLARERSLTNNEAQFLKLAGKSTRGLLAPHELDGDAPPLLKIDLIQDVDGNYRVAEVDSYNARGFGYFALLDGTIPEGFSRVGEGIRVLAQCMQDRQRSPDAEWFIIISDFERFYETVFGILASTLARHGVHVRLVREQEAATVLSKSEYPHVLIIPESMHAYPAVREQIVARYCDGDIRTLYPPAAYLGSKAFLPFLAAQAGMREFIPPCALVSKKFDPMAGFNGAPLVLKGVMSSGMKRIVFSDLEPDRFSASYGAARGTKNPVWILQEQVPQTPIPIVVFDSDGRRTKRSYFLRITAYATAKGFLGAEVTGREDRMVHGAPDCIQIPVISL